MNIFLDIVFTLIDGCSCLYMIKNENVKKSRQISFLILFILIFCGLTQIFTLSELGIKLLFSYGIPIILGIFILDLSPPKASFYIGICCFLLTITELTITQLGVFVGIHQELEDGTSIPAMYIVVSKIIYITLLVVIQKIIYDINMKRFNLKTLLLFIFSNVGYMIVGICIFANIIYVQETMYSNVFLVCTVTMLVALIFNLIFLNKYLEIDKKEQEQRMAIYELDIQTRYYEEKIKEEERIKEIYHDLKNHILLIEGQENNEKIAIIKKEIMRYEDYYRTGNKFLDIILKDKISRAQNECIDIEDDINLEGIDFIEPFDISTIFGNLIDNAIEASRFIEDKEMKKIYIRATRKKGLILICIKNYKAELVSSKRVRKIIHGYGLINVMNAVHKYEGEVDIVEKENEYIVNIVIPNKAKDF